MQAKWSLWKFGRRFFFAEELHISNFIIESYYAPMVRRILEGKEDLSHLGHMVESPQRIFFPHILIIGFRYISRAFSVRAHLLGKYACNISNYLVWLKRSLSL